MDVTLSCGDVPCIHINTYKCKIPLQAMFAKKALLPMCISSFGRAVVARAGGIGLIDENETVTMNWIWLTSTQDSLLNSELITGKG